MEKIKIYITREKTSDYGTEGILYIPDLSFACYTMELPWKDNTPSLSCIPKGHYKLKFRKQGRRPAYHVQNVPGRSYILIHSGNFAGDTIKGLKSHVEGCILLGRTRAFLGGQKAILQSRPTVREFQNLMAEREAELFITDNFRGDDA